MKAITPFLNSITPSENINLFFNHLNLFNYEATDQIKLKKTIKLDKK